MGADQYEKAASGGGGPGGPFEGGFGGNPFEEMFSGGMGMGGGMNDVYLFILPFSFFFCFLPCELLVLFIKFDYCVVFFHVLQFFKNIFHREFGGEDVKVLLL